MNIIHQGFSSSFYGMPLQIIWHPTLNCNYHCSYCIQKEEGHARGRDWLDLDKARRMFDNLLELNRDDYLIGLTGGEPTIYPHLAPALRHIGLNYAEKLSGVYMVSNGSRNVELYESLAELSGLIDFSLFISIHTDHAALEDIRYLVEFLAPKTSLGFSLMFNPAKREKTRAFYEMLLDLRKAYPFTLSIQFIRDIPAGNIIDLRYTRADFEWQDAASREFSEAQGKSAKKFISRGFPLGLLGSRYSIGNDYRYEYITDQGKALKDGKYRHTGKFCVIGAHLLSIQPDGRAHNSLCNRQELTRKPLYEEGPYANADFCKIVQCAQPVCGCTAHDYLQKFSSLEEARDFLAFFQESQKRLFREFANPRGLHGLNKTIAKQKALLGQMKPEHFPLADYVEQAFYFARYPDVAGSGMSAADHYGNYGWKEGRNPNPWFDTLFYLSQFENQDGPGMNPLAHYILRGCVEGKKPAE